MKKKLTSGEWLGVGLTIFYAIIAFVSALGMEGSHTAMNKNNLFAGIAELLNMPNTPSYSGIWILLIFILVFLFRKTHPLLVLCLCSKDENNHVLRLRLP